MALSKVAGEGLQRECSAKEPVAVGDIAVLSQTGRLNCQAVIFAVCCDWNNGQGRKVMKRILTKTVKKGSEEGNKVETNVSDLVTPNIKPKLKYRAGD